MPHLVKLCITLTLCSLSACSSDGFKRATYGSLEQIKRQQCYREMGSNCEKSESYEVYQDKRKELKKSEKSF